MENEQFIRVVFDIFCNITEDVDREDYIKGGELDKYKFFHDYVKMYGYSSVIFNRGNVKNQAKRIHDICDRYFLDYYEEKFIKSALAGENIIACL